MNPLVATLLFVAFVNAVPVFDGIQEEWNAFKTQHNKEYQNKIEEGLRMKMFMNNKDFIAEHNQRYERGKVSFKLGLSKYVDMLPGEFTQTMNGFNQTAGSSIVLYNRRPKVEIPQTIDWRTTGAVTPVKDQVGCASWAISAAGSIESQQFLLSGKLVSLSAQHLIDCSRAYGNYGCKSGGVMNAFNYIMDNGGIDTEESYPYVGADNRCHFNKSSIGARVKGIVAIAKGDEEKLKQAVATIGPIPTAIDASHMSFRFYKGGVYYEPACDSQNRQHHVLVVGYGTDASGADYWLAKNSWGITWGEQGYIKMARNRNNHCGIASQVLYPLVE